MEESSWLDRRMNLPPRQLEMTPLRVFLGIAGPIAIAVAIAIFWYPLVLRIFVFDAAQYESYLQAYNARPLLFWLPILLTPFSNMSTALDMLRGRQLATHHRVALFAIVWALSIVPTTLYWWGEFRKAARLREEEVSTLVETG